MWVEPFSLPLRSPLETARGPIAERRGFLVGFDLDERVEGHKIDGSDTVDEIADDTDSRVDDGISGIGEATPLPGWTESYTECERALAAFATAETEPKTAPDTHPAAAHALELARLDARGRHSRTPLATLLRRTVFADDTASAPARVPVNATVGDADPETTAERALVAVDAGYDCLKCKVGVRDLDADVRRLRAVREAVDDDVAIRADANGAWDRPTAMRAVEAATELGLDYLEQPLAANDLAGHRQLRGRGVNIAVDESLTQSTIGDVIDADAADVVVLKPMALGGPLQATRAAKAAIDAAIDPVVTTTIDAVVARTAAVHVAAAIPDISPCGVATGSLLAADLAADPVVIENGEAHVPAGGGLCGDGFAAIRETRKTLDER